MVTRRLSTSWLYSSDLSRHRPMWIAIEASLFLIGALFWVDSMTGAQGFAEETWGRFAYTLPAWIWAAFSMASSSIIIVGLIRPVRSWMVSVGALMACINFFSLSYSAVFTDGVVVVGLYASLFFLPLHMWLLLEASTSAQRNN